ncbi:MAG: hypothetical protein ACRCT7_15640 [Shewanella sp.]|uniref:hypothetical protein n=1 Tax=Shewanella sp. SNU WT4 TaxID=2590015 RepID=UPI001125FA7D|nr:hypothetical protein [Shewanella sp. SNU WT4]QDF68719.1 hypothetical protein FJQ87_18620 [Shewanella sp. SNU WT4]
MSTTTPQPPLLDNKRKVLIGISATLLVAAAGTFVYGELSAPSAALAYPSADLTAFNNSELTGSEFGSNAYADLPIMSQSAEAQAPAQQLLNDPLPKSAELILLLSEQIQLNGLRETANKTALAAQESANALNGKTQSPSQLDKLFDNTDTQQQPANALDSLSIKSLVQTNQGVSGFVSLAGELIPIRQGTQIGDIRVVGMTSQYVDFSYRGNVTRKYQG